ncbi:DUF4255 domain-containing protein [Nannocystaceae bacterium ST9]
MSNTLAIATITALLEARINALLDGNGLSGFDVTVDHPRGDDPDSGVYIKPFRIAPNPSLRNDDLPTRRSDGSTSLRPRLAIDVDFLLTFVGDPGTYDPERLAGLVMIDLHANPVLGRQEIKDFLAGLPQEHVLAGSDLGEQIERIRFSPLPLDIEALSRVWGLFGLSIYGLSVAYQANVTIDAALRPTTPLPVLRTGMQTIPSVAPAIAALSSSGFGQALARIGDTLIVRGTNLRGPSTWLRLGATLLELEPASLGTDRLTLALTAALGLRAGVVAVQVVHRAELGPPADPLRTVAQSNAMALVILPSVIGTPTASGPGPIEVRVELVPLPELGQDVALILDPLAGGAQIESRTYSIEAAELVFVVASASVGDYLVRVRVDGAVSMLELGPDQSFQSPKVSVA